MSQIADFSNIQVSRHEKHTLKKPTYAERKLEPILDYLKLNLRRVGFR